MNDWKSLKAVTAGVYVCSSLELCFIDNLDHTNRNPGAFVELQLAGFSPLSNCAFCSVVVSLLNCHFFPVFRPFRFLDSEVEPWLGRRRRSIVLFSRKPPPRPSSVQQFFQVCDQISLRNKLVNCNQLSCKVCDILKNYVADIFAV